MQDQYKGINILLIVIALDWMVTDNLEALHWESMIFETTLTRLPHPCTYTLDLKCGCGRWSGWLTISASLVHLGPIREVLFQATLN